MTGRKLSRKREKELDNSTTVNNTQDVYLSIYLSIYLFIYLWLHWVFVAVHRLLSSCGEQGLLFIAVHGLLTVVASLVAEQGL